MKVHILPIAVSNRGTLVRPYVCLGSSERTLVVLGLLWSGSRGCACSAFPGKLVEDMSFVFMDPMLLSLRNTTCFLRGRNEFPKIRVSRQM